MNIRTAVVSGLLACGLLGGATAANADPLEQYLTNKVKFAKFMVPGSFPLTRPAEVADECAPKAWGIARVIQREETDVLHVSVIGMPKNSEVDVFAIQVPEAPFGMSWYLGDIETDENGHGQARFVNRFNEETFVVAPGIALAPQEHDNPIADAYDNPAVAPIHTYHIGIWFNSPEDAVSLGCAGATTPFNGEHTAGVQVLNTSLFPDQEGPLLDPELGF